LFFFNVLAFCWGKNQLHAKLGRILTFYKSVLGTAKFRGENQARKLAQYKQQPTAIVHLFKLQSVCNVVRKLLNLHQSHFNISVHFSSFVRPVFLTFGLELNMMWMIMWWYSGWSSYVNDDLLTLPSSMREVTITME
jgi:hypothetical protein